MPHDKAHCRYCQHPRQEPGQGGVEGLLDGRQMWIQPSGFEQAHLRGRTAPHRLQDPAKWIPYGVGAIDGTAGEPLAALPPGTEPGRDFAPGEEPRPREGEPTGWSHGELL